MRKRFGTPTGPVSQLAKAIWPHERFASREATASWANATATRITLDDWLGRAFATSSRRAAELPLACHEGATTRITADCVVGEIRGKLEMHAVDSNDGLATVDHMDEVGQVQATFDPAAGWDHPRFYRNLGFDLASRAL